MLFKCYFGIIVLFCNVGKVICRHNVTQTGAAAQPKGDAKACKDLSCQMEQRFYFPPEFHCPWRGVIGVELQPQAMEGNKYLFSLRNRYK